MYLYTIIVSNATDEVFFAGPYEDKETAEKDLEKYRQKYPNANLRIIREVNGY
jgi:hypothetical protein